MSLSAKQIKQLEKIIAAATELLKSATTGQKVAKKASRVRRSGKDLAAFRKLLATERASGMSVADIAKRHGVSTAYIYQIPAAKKSSVKKSAAKKTAARKVVAKKGTRKSANGPSKASSAAEITAASSEA